MMKICFFYFRKLCIAHRENLKGRDHFEDVGVDGNIILEPILGNRMRRCGLNAPSLV
jgi:hypothetical protein